MPPMPKLPITIRVEVGTAHTADAIQSMKDEIAYLHERIDGLFTRLHDAAHELTGEGWRAAVERKRK